LQPCTKRIARKGIWVEPAQRTLKPAQQIWCRSAAPWINDIGDWPGMPSD
jgi:hypothetical protein